MDIILEQPGYHDRHENNKINIVTHLDPDGIVGAFIVFYGLYRKYKNPEFSFRIVGEWSSTPSATLRMIDEKAINIVIDRSPPGDPNDGLDIKQYLINCTSEADPTNALICIDHHSTSIFEEDEEFLKSVGDRYNRILYKQGSYSDMIELTQRWTGNGHEYPDILRQNHITLIQADDSLDGTFQDVSATWLAFKFIQAMGHLHEADIIQLRDLAAAVSDWDTFLWTRLPEDQCKERIDKALLINSLFITFNAKYMFNLIIQYFTELWDNRSITPFFAKENSIIPMEFARINTEYMIREYINTISYYAGFPKNNLNRNGIRFIFINTDYIKKEYMSIISYYIFQKQEFKNSVILFVGSNGAVSVRTDRTDIHAGEFAERIGLKLYGIGGGGHAQSAGFHTQGTNDSYYNIKERIINAI